MYHDPPYTNGRDARGLDVRTGLDEDRFNRLGRHADGRTREAPRPLGSAMDPLTERPEMMARLQELLL